ncbi:E3 ubiquitin-protein ligase E3D-like isoform X2 [Sceloporus undulatus]|uniref:E3 ubiquitin-protein ligase E3D-like isoform X2 n=1 Tax=Sceloporus undulatus TaxID=8520 RepID=UPI001C4C07B4|nr:E3 ubiquitin-protein ligase E3D-like isoform X2 [Sceloporus undulatus]
MGSFLGQNPIFSWLALMALFLEVRQRTQTGLLIIRELKLESWPVDITVMPSLIELKTGEDCKALKLPQEVKLVPSSCRGLQYVPGDGLHMRFLVQASLNTEMLPTVGDSLKSKKRFTFYCQTCGESIISDQTFLRVLSLPSENWSDLVDEWCCHPNPFNESVFHPQKNDCFLGHNYFLINPGNESPESGFQICHSESQDPSSKNSGSASNSEANSRVICKRCRTLLGEVMPSGVTKYYFTELLVQPSEDCFNTIPRSLFIQSAVARCLVELSSSRSTFRFSIEGTDGAVYILIWLLNSDTLLVESLGNIASSEDFTLLEHAMPSDSRPSKIQKAIKLLYHPCIKSRNKDLYDTWRNDTGVHPLRFPSKTCLDLLLILSQSTASLPPSLQWMNSFQRYFL